MTEHRHFERIKFSVQTEIGIGDSWYDARVEDIALKGALVSLPPNAPLATGIECTLRIRLSLSDVIITCEGQVVHCRNLLCGIKFTRIPIDSMIHLRRLVELNSSHPDHIRHELMELVTAD